ncbi:hypothetical protein CP973_19430 [Streptomyces albofaciens JCM 4342]|nr:hypothetical protein CP973_19430 [Streptomyces albofaciens JCM 4342]
MGDVGGRGGELAPTGTGVCAQPVKRVVQADAQAFGSDRRPLACPITRRLSRAAVGCSIRTA